MSHLRSRVAKLEKQSGPSAWRTVDWVTRDESETDDEAIGRVYGSGVVPDLVVLWAIRDVAPEGIAA
jgi:hypothetical protein